MVHPKWGPLGNPGDGPELGNTHHFQGFRMLNLGGVLIYVILDVFINPHSVHQIPFFRSYLDPKNQPNIHSKKGSWS